MKQLLQDRTARRGRARAFTLIELLVVIVVIALLVAILAPAVLAAIRLANAAKSQLRITELNQAGESYYQEKKAYPGQNGLEGLTGSRKLAVDLFGPDLTKPDLKYASCKLESDARRSDLFDPRTISPNICASNQPNSISDRFGTRPMPILYYPARVTETGLAQYVDPANAPNPYPDNDAYLVHDPANPKSEDSFDPPWYKNSFQAYVMDPRDTTKPWNSGRFILIAAGVDRKLGTADDLTNRPK